MCENGGDNMMRNAGDFKEMLLAESQQQDMGLSL